MNRQDTVIASVPLNTMCINHTNETSRAHHFGRFKTIRVSTMWCTRVHVFAITCIYYLPPTLSSVSSITFIVCFLFRKTTGFSISFFFFFIMYLFLAMLGLLFFLYCVRDFCVYTFNGARFDTRIDYKFRN